MTEDGFLKSAKDSSLASIGIDLGAFHKALQGDKGNYRSVKDDRGGVSSAQSGYGLPPLNKDFTYRPLTILYPPLNNIRTEDLTYEIFLEIINKTDWLLRGLVVSLEKKLSEDHKGYQISQAKIQDTFRK